MAQSGESARFGSERLGVRIPLPRPSRASGDVRSHADVAQLGRGSRLRICNVRVRIPPSVLRLTRRAVAARPSEEKPARGRGRLESGARPAGRGVRVLFLPLSISRDRRAHARPTSPWWNGIHGSLRCCALREREGSNPSGDTARPRAPRPFADKTPSLERNPR